MYLEDEDAAPLPNAAPNERQGDEESMRPMASASARPLTRIRPSPRRTGGKLPRGGRCTHCSEPSACLQPDRRSVRTRRQDECASAACPPPAHRLNPAMEMASTQDSLPPATMTSASPRRMKWAASPTACAPLAQAVTTAWLGPCTSTPPRQTPNRMVGVGVAGCSPGGRAPCSRGLRPC